MSEVSAIDLAGEITERLNSTTSPGAVKVLTYNDASGQPHPSIRASLHVFSADQLALWVRDGYVGTMTPSNAVPGGGFLKAIESNPLVGVLFRDPESRSTFVFSGHARVASEADVQDAVFAGIPQGEKNHSTESGERTGTAVLIDLDHVVGGTLGQGGVILTHTEMMRRS